MSELEIGLDTFGDRTWTSSGVLESHAQVLRNVVEQAERADRLGLAFFGVGEHHRDDFAVSAPEVLLAAIAGRSFTESFPLFGYDLGRYEELFDDKLDLFSKVRAGGPITWSGSTRPPLNNQPRPIGVHSPGHVAETDDRAREELGPHYHAMRSKIGAERGWPPPTRAQFDREATARCPTNR
jgi:alkanesulfonate monooxygenase SsuD/methylene tetrahydromethanopterin reductase-like flavin-dependent oxidoreductase (luciferase family)